MVIKRPKALPFIILIIALISLCITPVSAETLVSETLSEWIDTGSQEEVDVDHYTGTSVTMNGLYFNTIENHRTLNYVAIDVPASIGQSPLEEGSNALTYVLDGQTHTGTVRIEKTYTVLGVLTHTRATLFLDDWDIGDLTGPVIVSTNKTYLASVVANTVAYIPSSSQKPICAPTGPNNFGGTGFTFDQIHTVTVSSGSLWENQISIVTQNQGSDTLIQLTREIGGEFYPSTLNITNIDGSVSFTDYNNEDVEYYTLTKYIQKIDIISLSGEVYTYPIVTTITAPGTISIRSTETGALIPGARLIIYDSLAGETIINQTLASGAGSFTFTKSDTLRYNASATAENYTLIFPILFSGADSTAVTLWMAPTAAPDVPVEEGKSTLYGYILTQGNQQPISGATVSLNGYGSTTTTSTGFYLFNNVTPGTYDLSASATLHDALTEPVTVEAPATQHNLALTGHYLLTVVVKDGDTLANVQNATIVLSDGQESTANPATFNGDYGPYSITAAAGGYYPVTQSAYLDHPGTTTATVLLTAHPEQTPAPEYPNYPPHNVRFHCIDDYGGPLKNVTLSAAYLETTTPWSWFTDLLGIPSSVSINETTLNGTTGTDGSIVFSMVETVQYALTAHDPASNLTVNFTLYPQETQYTIQFRTRPAASAETYPIYILEAVPLEGDTQVSLRLAYKDRDNATTSLSFWVKDDAGEYVHTDTLEPTLLNWTNTSYTVENHPTSYTWGFDAQHATRDDISAARTIILHGSGRLVDLGFEDDFWYYLLSALWIIGLGALFSGSRVKFGAIIIPLIGGGIPVLIGWLPLATAALVGVLTFIGVFVYMRKSEYKLYR